MDAHRAQRIRDRDAAVRRLRRLTATTLTGAGILAAAFAGLAAKAFPGRSARPAVGAATRTVAPVAPAHPAAAQPPPLVAVHTAAPTPSPTAPSPAPAPTAAPPVVVSGGS